MPNFIYAVHVQAVMSSKSWMNGLLTPPDVSLEDFWTKNFIGMIADAIVHGISHAQDTTLIPHSVWTGAGQPPPPTPENTLITITFPESLFDFQKLYLIANDKTKHPDIRTVAWDWFQFVCKRALQTVIQFGRDFKIAKLAMNGYFAICPGTRLVAGHSWRKRSSYPQDPRIAEVWHVDNCSAVVFLANAGQCVEIMPYSKVLQSEIDYNSSARGDFLGAEHRFVSLETKPRIQTGSPDDYAGAMPPTGWPEDFIKVFFANQELPQFIVSSLSAPVLSTSCKDTTQVNALHLNTVEGRTFRMLNAGIRLGIQLRGQFPTPPPNIQKPSVEIICLFLCHCADLMMQQDPKKIYYKQQDCTLPEENIIRAAKEATNSTCSGFSNIKSAQDLRTALSRDCALWQTFVYNRWKLKKWDVRCIGTAPLNWNVECKTINTFRRLDIGIQICLDSYLGVKGTLGLALQHVKLLPSLLFMTSCGGSVTTDTKKAWNEQITQNAGEGGVFYHVTHADGYAMTYSCDINGREANALIDRLQAGKGVTRFYRNDPGIASQYLEFNQPQPNSDYALDVFCSPDPITGHARVRWAVSLFPFSSARYVQNAVFAGGTSETFLDQSASVVPPSAPSCGSSSPV